jgi:hypothetical protein
MIDCYFGGSRGREHGMGSRILIYIYIYREREREREGERELRTTLLPCPMITALLLVAKKLPVGDMLAAAASKGWLHLLL